MSAVAGGASFAATRGQTSSGSRAFGYGKGATWIIRAERFAKTFAEVAAANEYLLPNQP